MGAIPLLAANLSFASCFHAGAEPRSAELIEKGDFAPGGVWSAVAYAPGSFDLTTGKVSGNASQRFRSRYLIALPAVAYVGMGTQVAGRYGASERWELGCALGVQELLLESRVSMLSERRGAPVAMALGWAVAYRPSLTPSAPNTRLALDVSRRWGPLSTMANLFLSFGPESHAIAGPSSWGSCDTIDLGCEDPFLFVRRVELRAAMALGVGWHLTDTPRKMNPPTITVGIVPYVTAWALAPERLECRHCPDGRRPTGFSELAGASVVLTVGPFPVR